jgi:hypothetical protein
MFTVAAIERPGPSYTTVSPAREPDELIDLIKPRLDAASRPAVLLDYDGTLREFVNVPSEATPTNNILRILENIQSDERIHLALISGRDAGTLNEWFGHLDITLVAEPRCVDEVWERCKVDHGNIAPGRRLEEADTRHVG